MKGELTNPVYNNLIAMISKMMIVASLLAITLPSIDAVKSYPHTPTEFFFTSLIDHFANGGDYSQTF
jgi:hypothetical protein